jgi:transcriptional regulator with XRE-family HTH domain
MINVDRIRLRRLELRLTQADLGKSIGQDQAYVSKIERGQVTGMTVAMLERIAEALGVRPDSLLKGKRKTRRVPDDVEREPTQVA